MKKGIFLVLTLLIPFSMSCSSIDDVNVDDLSTGLDAVQNLHYDNQVIYFDAVKDAMKYRLEIEYQNNIVFTKDISKLQYDIETLGLIGNNVAYVTAFNTSKKSDRAKLDFTITGIDSDTIYEGEHGLLGYGDNNNSNYRNNPLAHNGAYAGGLDDCGNGLHFDHYSYLAGERTVEIFYMTAYPGSVHLLYVNGQKQAKVVYEENTGWGGVDKFSPRKATAKINLQVGWNTIELMKYGLGSDNPAWGGFAEIDYIVIKGSGQEYIVDKDPGIPTFKLQGEMATAIKWDGKGWTTKNPAIYYPNSSNMYMLGNIDNEGEGAEYHVNVPKKGYYKLQMAYSQDNDMTTFATINTSEAPRIKVKLDLPTRTGWGNPTLSTWTENLEFAQDGNYITIKKVGDTGPFQIDYILLEYVGEIS